MRSLLWSPPRACLAKFIFPHNFEHISIIGRVSTAPPLRLRASGKQNLCLSSLCQYNKPKARHSDKMKKKWKEQETEAPQPYFFCMTWTTKFIPSSVNRDFMSESWLVAGYGQLLHSYISQSLTQINNLVHQPQSDKFIEILNKWPQCNSYLTQCRRL